MKKYFIINLNRLGDIFQSAHLMSSIKKENPHSEINYITYRENKKAVDILCDIDEAHFIDRKKISAFFQNSIYSDGLAFNELERSLSKVFVKEGDVVLNYSNDRVGGYLTSFLSENISNYKGIRFSEINTVEYSSDAAILLNDIQTSFLPTPFNFNDCYHKLLDLPFSLNNKSVVIDSGHSSKAREGLELLRLSKRTDKGNGVIVGIQVSSSSDSKDITEAALIGLLGHLNDHPRTIPVLLVSPAQAEKERAGTLNSYFSNELISIESDFSALPSVLQNIDLLITPDTSVKHLADLTSTPTLEVSLGESPFLKQGSIGTKSLIMTLGPSLRTFQKTDLSENSKINGSDLFLAATQILNIENHSAPISFSDEVLIYRPMSLDGGTYYMPTMGHINTVFELRRFFSRTIIERNYFNKFNKNAFGKMISVFNREEIRQFISSEQEIITRVTKDLLSTLRSLVQLQENQNNSSAFVNSLEKLLSHAFQTNLGAVSILDFRARLEAITSTDLKSNLKETESLLYQLKTQLKNTLTILQSASEDHLKPTQNLEQRL